MILFMTEQGNQFFGDFGPLVFNFHLRPDEGRVIAENLLLFLDALLFIRQTR